MFSELTTTQPAITHEASRQQQNSMARLTEAQSCLLDRLYDAPIEIILNRPEKTTSVGIDLEYKEDTHGLPEVTGITPGGVADTLGCLKIGDAIQQVDGYDVSDGTHALVSAFSKAGCTLTFLIRRALVASAAKERIGKPKTPSDLELDITTLRNSPIVLKAALALSELVFPERLLPKGAHLHVLNVRTGGQGRKMAIAFFTWQHGYRKVTRAHAHRERLRTKAAKYALGADERAIFKHFLLWMRFAVGRITRQREEDRRSIETAIAVAELESVWGTPLASYPEPNSTAACDECNRVWYRYYHASKEDTHGSGDLDLCESCFVVGEIAESMSAEIRAAFTLVMPLVAAEEAWRDVNTREREITRAAYATKAADLGQKRGEAQLAARLFEAAAAQARAQSAAQVMVTARFPFGGQQQTAVPVKSRAAILGARDPTALGQAVLNVIGDLKGASSLASLQDAIKTQLLDFAENFTPLGTPEYQKQAPGSMASASPWTGSPARQLLAMVQQRSESIERNLQGNIEASFLLKQVSTIVAEFPAKECIPTEALFDTSEEPALLTVPAGCAAASLAPAALGTALLHATRRAPSRAAAKAALIAMLLPPEKG
jgi:hypothetical protein